MTETEQRQIEDAAHAAAKRDVANGTPKVTASEAAVFVPLIKGNRESGGERVPAA